jgi:hypothetical protein
MGDGLVAPPAMLPWLSALLTFLVIVTYIPDVLTAG